MNDFTTIKTFSYPNELAVIRARLESEGIECFVKDEFTVQLNPFYSNALSGIKLQVRKEDVPSAIEILKDAGMIPDMENQPSKLYDGLDAATDKIPFLKNMSFEKKLYITGAIIFLITITLYTIYSGPHQR